MRVRPVAALLALLVAVPAAGQYFGKNKIRYDDFAWQEYSTPHFRISFYDRVQPALPRVASFAESAYDELARKLNFQIPEPIPMLIYASHAEFEQTNVLVEFIPEGVGAFAVPARNRMVLPVDMPDEELLQLIQHELTHVFQFEILYQGKLGKAITSRPPQWFMEGMASYLGDDEDARARAVMRDAVFSDQVPSVGSGVYGYFAYRFGHMVFKFVETEWGVEGLRDFIFEFRNAMGGGVERALDRAFDLDVDEFDARFRAWLRRYYEPELDGRGDPRDFGPSFRAEEGVRSVETSPAAAPSGDIIAAFSTYKSDIDVVLLGVPDRRLTRNLTKGYTTKYQYVVAQALTVGPQRGKDLAFSPDGDTVAVFARKERARVLLLLDALKGGIRREIDIPYDQPMAPAYSNDGKTLAFQAYKDAQADVFLLDLATGEFRNLTQDASYDSAPTFTPNGDIVYSSQSGEHAKLYEISLADPSKRRQLTFGSGDDEGATFSRDGKRLYFASDRDRGIFDLYSLDLETRALKRLTTVVGAAVNPVPVVTRDGERVVYQAYTKGRWWLYLADPAQATDEGSEQPPQEQPKYTPFVPSVTVTVTPDKISEVKRHKLFLDDAQVFVGFDTDNTLLGATYLSFSDHYGDRRALLYLESVEGYSNFRLQYASLANRTQWGVTLLDDRSYWVAYQSYSGRTERVQQLFRQTGGYVFASHPLSLYYRAEGAIGYYNQTANYPVLNPDGSPGFMNLNYDVPFVQVGLIGDTTLWREYGPHGGRRWSLQVASYFDASAGGTLSRDYVLDARQYVPLTRRNELAFRLYGAWADGNNPNIYYFGGMDTLRGYDYRAIAGNRVAYLNAEWRFPLIDYLILPWLQVGNLRGRIFVDVGAAYFEYGGLRYTSTTGGIKPGFDFMDDGTLVDGISSYGFGFSVNLFGMPMHWDYAKLWNFDTSTSGYRTVFWIGFRY